MADREYTVADRAKLVAESMQINPHSFTGREGDALAAMAVLAGYPRMSQNERNKTLYDISRQFADMPAFVNECSTQAGMMVANHVWVPGSMTQDELEKEIDFWRTVKGGLDQIGARSVGSYMPSNNGGLTGAGKAITTDAAKTAGVIGATQKVLGGPLRPAGAAVAGSMAFSTLAATITESSLSDLQAEVTRRGQLRTMSPLEVERYGTRPAR